MIDLEADKWPSFHLPYMNSLHSSAITCSQHISNVPEQLWSKIVDVGGAQFANLSKRVRNFVLLLKRSGRPRKSRDEMIKNDRKKLDMDSADP